MQRTCTYTPTEAELHAYAVGIDVSEYQDEPDWDAVAGAGYSFAFLRTSSGKRVDVQFKRNWREAHRVGMRVGVYHYFRAGIGGVLQGDLMAEQVALVGGFQKGDLGAALDLEEAGQEVDGEALDPRFVLQESRAFLSVAEKRTRWRPLVYTGQYFHWKVSQRLPELAAGWGHYPLWLPAPGSCPRMPVGPSGEPFPWKTWSFWQYSHTGAVPGIHGSVDLNYFHGTEDDLARFAKTQAPGGGGGAALALGVIAGGAFAMHYFRSDA